MDVPYETSSLFVYFMQCVDPERAVIYCKNSCFKEDEIIAEYSTEAKAIKVMEMLRERHTDNAFCREDIQYKAEIMLDDGLDIVREMMMKCEYFQFPKDDEIEVVE